MSATWSSPAMPQDVAELFNFLCEFVFAIHDKWEDFGGLCVPRDFQEGRYNVPQEQPATNPGLNRSNSRQRD